MADFHGVRGVKPLDPMGHDPDDFTPPRRRSGLKIAGIVWLAALALLLIGSVL